MLLETILKVFILLEGANINNILNFQKDYDEVEVFKLEQNYRSTKNIVKAANSLINHNKYKLEKTIWTNNEEGEKVIIKKCFSDNDEGKYVAKSILETVTKKNLNIILLQFYIGQMLNQELLRNHSEKIIYHTKFMEVFLFIKEKKLKMFLLI